PKQESLAGDGLSALPPLPPATFISTPLREGTSSKTVPPPPPPPQPSNEATLVTSAPFAMMENPLLTRSFARMKISPPPFPPAVAPLVLSSPAPPPPPRKTLLAVLL